MKKPLALFLAAAMLASYPAAAMTAGAEEIGEETSSFSYTVGKNVKNRSAKIFGDFEYAENDGNAVIVGYLGSDEEVVIPGRIDGFEVTVIGSEAFCDNTNLKSVVIPDSVTIIEDSAFIDCTGLTNVKFSENLAVIETNAFFGCSGLTKIELSENVAEIGKSAFYNCNSLKTAVIPNPDIEIGKLAFSKRSTELIIFCPTESNAVDFAKNGLGFCTYNVDEDDNIEISEFSSSVSEFEIPEKIDGKNVTVIGDGAFNKSIRLSSVKFPESLKTIGDEAFQNCLALERIDIPKNVENIGSQAFFGCSSLNDIYVYSKKAVVSDEAFLVGNKDLVIHAYSGTDSNSYADDNDIYFVPLDFHYSKNYGTVTEYCGDDKNVTVPKKIMGVEVTKVEVTAFDNAYLDDDVKNSVETINIPSTVKTLSGDVFDELPALSAVKVDSDNKKFKDIDGILYNKKGTAIIRCPEGYGSFISNGSGGEFILPESVTSVEKGAFENVSGLSKVVINPVFDGEGKEEKISIGDDVFDGCENLRNVTVYSKAVDFGENSPITVDESPDVVMYGYLGSTAWDYAYDTSFKEKEVPFVPLDFRYDVVKNPETGDDEVKITGYDGDIDDLTLPAKIGGIPVTAVGTDGENPFFVGENSDDESPLVNLTVPKEILDLDPDIFDDLPNLESISVDPENPNYADEDGVLFDKDKTELLRYPEAKDDEKYTVPETVEKIAPGAFEDCDNLSEVEIPENVGEIGDNAFSDCDNLEKAVIYDPEAVFDGTPFANDEDTLTIYGYLDSTADDYADENNIPFVPLDVRFIVNPENEDEVIITGYDGDNDVLNIPDNIGGKPVVGLDTDDKPFAGEGNTITDVTIPEGVTDIDPDIFDGMPELENISVDDNNPNYSDDDGVLFDKDMDELLRYPEGKEDEEYTVPDEVKKIGDGAFKDCDDLEKVVILDNVDDIADDAFDNHNPDLEIHGYEGTEAEVYADEHEIKWLFHKKRLILYCK